MKLSPSMLLVAGLVVAVVVLVVTRPDGADVALARKETQAAIDHANVVLSQNQSLKQRADSALAVAAVAEKKAVVAQSQLADAKRSLFKAALAAPDTCAPVVLAAQEALNRADDVIHQRTDELAGALAADSADRKRADDAEAALADLKKPAQTLVAETNEGLLTRLKHLRPELQVGVMGGVDVQGKPNAVVGVGFGWHF